MDKNPTLGIETFRYSDLYDYDGLGRLSQAFDDGLAAADGALFARFDAYRAAIGSGIANGGLSLPDESALLIDVSRELGTFVTRLFQIDAPVGALRTRAMRDTQVARFKKEFVAKRVAKSPGKEGLDTAATAIIETLGGSMAQDPELALATAANRLLDLEKEYPRAAKELNPSTEAREQLGQIREKLRSTPEASTLFGETILH